MRLAPAAAAPSTSLPPRKSVRVLSRAALLAAGLCLLLAPLVRGSSAFVPVSPERSAAAAATVDAEAASWTHSRRAAIVGPAALVAFGESAIAADEPKKTKFKKVRTQFIAALADPGATSGTGAEKWGLWKLDPGPRGVTLGGGYEGLKKNGGVAPAKWKFDNNDWWLEEHGLIMEPPDTPLTAGKYMVTGAREVTAALTVYPMEGGTQRWELADGAKLYDVTHLPCRSARYTNPEGGSCSPDTAKVTDFPVMPGAPMPPVTGCNKQDYAVIFVVAVEV
ncbi:unnamed protein product [Polarella glacialis]|uniref:Uncharacterized protein n=1 Tax=Polarella glacialis TaxID=89957 RepID=A0A813DH63_POLGL|nr:unnamed protein product [Polarella glacialis]CAE8685341.1 unnamed protein product [Polarella glacialis]|eukprot:CAMPEP_0115090324 /NCGR_PEP_ID=MMETSP0227-20121206/25345_1 /TAXON_ID=89957 /ORGANISM="Polarella glacialis, Strain CCMP 1383" /LENGTH=278 /DNA_ID=CAMNT_0002481415 /DNA_START=331 /DNA_END=1167 /DNA_ORIENTATION=-